jgi:hypothetical protein
MVLLAVTGWGQDEDRQQLLALSDDQLKIKTPDSPEQYPSEKRL